MNQALIVIIKYKAMTQNQELSEGIFQMCLLNHFVNSSSELKRKYHCY